MLCSSGNRTLTTAQSKSRSLEKLSEKQRLFPSPPYHAIKYDRIHPSFSLSSFPTSPLSPSSHTSSASFLPSPEKPPAGLSRQPAHLNLAIVADSLDGDGAPQNVVRVSRLQLNDGFGPPHQAGHGALRLNELLLFILTKIKAKHWQAVGG